MAKRIPGPHDEKVLPIKGADQELKTALQDVLENLRWLAKQVNARYIIGFALIRLFEADNTDLEAQLRRAADAIANWRAVSQGISEQEYGQLNHANEEARAQIMKDRRKERRRKK